MIALLCLLAILGLGQCTKDDAVLPTRDEIESSINRTIDEVQRMIRENPSLPRLSRQEIVGILYNITAKDLDTRADKTALEQTREMYRRALMVVLPYNTNETMDNLKDLYTKPPLVQMISDSNRSHETSAKDTGDSSGAGETFENFVTHVSEKSTAKNQPTTTKTRYKNHRETYSDVRTKATFKEGLKLDSSPVKISFNLANLQKGYYSSAGGTTKNSLIKDNEQSGEKLEIVYSTSVTTEPTTRINSKEISIDLTRPTSTAASKANQNVLSSDQWHYNAPPTTTQKSTSEKYPDVKHDYVLSIAKKPENSVELSTWRPELSTRVTIMSKGHRVSERPGPVYVTPMSSTSRQSVDTTTALKTSEDVSSENPKSTESTATMRPEVMDLLAAIGLRPDNKSNVEDVYRKNQELLESKLQIPESNSVFHSTASALTAAGVDSTSIVGQNTFENSAADYKKGMVNLSPDVQLLFQRFGLQTSQNQEASSTSTTRKPTVSMNSYTNFKPLPASRVKDKEMKDFLAQFGLGVNEHRNMKSVKAVTQPSSVIEAVPTGMRQILANIGLISSTPRVIRTTPRASLTDLESVGTTKYHVFKPHESIVKDEGQRVKINELLDTVRLVQEGKASAQDVQKAANELLETTKTLKDGPDPLSLEEIIRIYNEGVRNEVKRQQSDEQQKNSTETEPSTQTNSASPDDDQETGAAEKSTTMTSGLADSGINISNAISTTTESGLVDFGINVPTEKSATTTKGSGLVDFGIDIPTQSPNLVALEESFGGSTSAPDPVLPTRKKSGLYFLVDWNTFLEVGENEAEKVNLRFQPKVGDRTRFLPVTIP